MDVKSFKKIVLNCLCFKCGKIIQINPLNPVHWKLGCVCPHCKAIVNANNMMDGIIRVNRGKMLSC